MSNVQDADKIAKLLEELNRSPSVTIREGVTPQAPTGTRPLSQATLDDLRGLSGPDVNEKAKIKAKLRAGMARALPVLAFVGAAVAAAPEALAADFVLDESTCENELGGNWLAASLECGVTDFELIGGDSLVIPRDVTLRVDGTSLNEGQLMAPS